MDGVFGGHASDCRDGSILIKWIKRTCCADPPSGTRARKWWVKQRIWRITISHRLQKRSETVALPYLLVDVHLLLVEGDLREVRSAARQTGQLPALLELDLSSSEEDAAHYGVEPLLPALAFVVDPFLPHLLEKDSDDYKWVFIISWYSPWPQ